MAKTPHKLAGTEENLAPNHNGLGILEGNWIDRLFREHSGMKHKIQRPFSIGLAIFFIWVSGQIIHAEERSHKEPVEWVDSSGKYTVTAKFRRIDGDAVILRLTDGRDMRIPLDRLSSESVEQAKAMASGRFAAKEKAKTDNAIATPSSASSSSSGPLDNLDAKQFVDRIMSDVKQNRLITLWDAIPSQKQKDIEDLVGSFAKQLDSRTFEMVRKTRNTVFEIARKQQQFILNSSVLAYSPEQKAILEKSYPAFVNQFESMLPKEFFDNKRLQKGDLRTLLSEWSDGMVASAEQFAKTVPEGSPLRSQLAGGSEIPYSVESVSSSEVKLKMKLNPTAGPLQEVEIPLVRSEGRWLPKDMVNSWGPAMGQAKAVIASMNGELIHQQVSTALIFANGPLQSLKNAKSQDEFDKVLKGLMDTAQSMAMGARGGMGPGGPPPGGFAPGGFPPPGSQPPPADANSGAGSASNEK